MTADPVPAPAGDAPVADQTDGDAPKVAQPPERWDVGLWLKWGSIGAAALVVAAFFGAYLLPREPEVTRSIDIAAPRAAVFPLVADLRHLPDWLPRLADDPKAAITFTGPLDGVGQRLSWESALPAVGSGVETITAIVPESSVAMRVARAGQPESEAWFRLSQKSARETTVVWGYRTNVGFNPVNRYRAALALDGIVGPDYERGLKRLKAVAEALPKSN